MCNLKIDGSLYRYVSPMVSTDPNAKTSIHDLVVLTYTIKTGLTSCMLNVNIRFRVQYILGLKHTSYDYCVHMAYI
jgi:hypothetical protein